MGADRKRITIAGGGLAGLALGIELRQRGVPVRLFEAGQYPRHRVCGEFISGHGAFLLKTLGMDAAAVAHARLARTVRFFVGARASLEFTLPEPALCISRWRLDTALAETFARTGGELITRKRWKQEHAGEGVVLATGRKPAVVAAGWRWIGLKVHARNVALETDLEMHFVPGGYVGLCEVEEGVVNVCGLFRSRTPLPMLSEHWGKIIAGRGGSVLSKRLADAAFVDQSFCSVAGLDYRAANQRASELRIGDAFGLIPPIAGHGMSLAFESAALTAEAVARYSAGACDWPEAREEVWGEMERSFGQRLRWGRWLQLVLFQPLMSVLAVHAAGSTVFNGLFHRTRSG